MAFLSSGTFLMGAGASDPDAGDNERPAHPVTVDAFCLDVTEVTVASYRRCTKEPRSAVTCPPAPTTAESKGSAKGFDLKLWSLFCNADRADRNDHPINCVDWRTAATYCAWAGGALPTEAQWEYAARGKEARTYPWGNEPVPGPTLLNACGSECRDLGKIHGQSWGVMYEDDDGAGATAKVASYPKGATPEGLVDLAGNVWEWVADANAGYRLPPTDSARIKPSWRVLRGGGWHHDSPHVARATFRLFNDEANRNSNVGFRCARPPTP
jgi:formylglycine-generating enzyme required for sulfatase activity